LKKIPKMGVFGPPSPTEYAPGSDDAWYFHTKGKFLCENFVIEEGWGVKSPFLRDFIYEWPPYELNIDKTNLKASRYTIMGSLILKL